jgi:hypothetical protein
MLVVLNGEDFLRAVLTTGGTTKAEHPPLSSRAAEETRRSHHVIENVGIFILLRCFAYSSFSKRDCNLLFL